MNDLHNLRLSYEPSGEIHTALKKAVEIVNSEELNPLKLPLDFIFNRLYTEIKPGDTKDIAEANYFYNKLAGIGNVLSGDVDILIADEFSIDRQPYYFIRQAVNYCNYNQRPVKIRVAGFSLDIEPSNLEGEDLQAHTASQYYDAATLYYFKEQLKLKNVFKPDTYGDVEDQIKGANDQLQRLLRYAQLTGQRIDVIYKSPVNNSILKFKVKPQTTPEDLVAEINKANGISGTGLG